jgi:hypothetical protein
MGAIEYLLSCGGSLISLQGRSEVFPWESCDDRAKVLNTFLVRQGSFFWVMDGDNEGVDQENVDIRPVWGS